MAIVEIVEEGQRIRLSFIEWTLEEQTIQKRYCFSSPYGFAELASAAADWGEILSKRRVKTCVLSEEDARRKCGTIPDPEPVYKPGETVYWLGSKAKAGTDGQKWEDREPSIDPFVVTQANYYPGDAGGFWLYFCHGNVEEEPNRNFHDAHIGRLVFSTYDQAEEKLEKGDVK